MVSVLGGSSGFMAGLRRLFVGVFALIVALFAVAAMQSNATKQSAPVACPSDADDPLGFDCDKLPPRKK
jgi:hypothetical protein